jgi:putative FmdB family regulatory protein
MPMYDFSCSQCGKDFEELVPRDYREVPCPACGSINTKRQLSLFSSRTGALSGSGGFAPSGGGGCAPKG